MKPDTPFRSSAGNSLHQVVVRHLDTEELKRSVDRHKAAANDAQRTLIREQQMLRNAQAELDRRERDAEHRRLAHELNHAVLDVRDAQEREAALRQQLAELHR